MPAAACQRLDQQWPQQRKPGPRSHHSCRDFNKGEQGGFCVLLGGIQRVALGSYRVHGVRQFLFRSSRSLCSLALLIEAETAANAPFRCVMASCRACSSSTVTRPIVTQVRSAAFSSN
jgi:hypothetical protein